MTYINGNITADYTYKRARAERDRSLDKRQREITEYQKNRLKRRKYPSYYKQTKNEIQDIWTKSGFFKKILIIFIVLSLALVIVMIVRRSKQQTKK